MSSRPAASRMALWSSVLLAMLVWLPASLAWADVRPVKNTIRLNNIGSPEQCVAEAKRQGVALAVKQVANSLKMATDNELVAALANNGSVVTETQHEVRDDSEGRCVVMVLTKVDATALKTQFTEMMSRTGGGGNVAGKGRVGTLLRFVVDGKPTDVEIWDPRIALQKMKMELQEHGIELIALDRFVKDYQDRSKKESTPIEQETKITKVDTSTMEAMVEDMLKDLKMLAKKGVAGIADPGEFDLLVTGQVWVSKPMKNPDGPGHVADVITYLSFKELQQKGAAVEMAVDQRSGQVRAASERLAISRAMEDSITGAVRSIVSRLATRNKAKQGQ